MFMQQLPKPGPGACVAVDEWERMRTSAPLKTPALYMTVFAAGDASSSAGVPYTVTVPGEIGKHTSELQSPYDLVCRLLLEKKKQTFHTLRHQAQTPRDTPPR